MLHAVGSGVMALQRTEFGGLRLDTTGECGSWRVLDAAEVEKSLGYQARELPETGGAGRRRGQGWSVGQGHA